MNCALNIYAPIDSYLYIQVISFVTEQGFDVFKVYDNTNRQVYSGSGIVANFQLSLSQPIRFTFTSDASNTGTGVNVIVTVLQVPTLTTTSFPSITDISSSPSISASPRKSVSGAASVYRLSISPSPSVSRSSTTSVTESLSYSVSRSASYSSSASHTANMSYIPFFYTLSPSMSQASTASLDAVVSFQATITLQSALSVESTYTPSLQTSTPFSAPSAQQTSTPFSAPSAQQTPTPFSAPSAQQTSTPFSAPSAQQTSTPFSAPSAQQTSSPFSAPSAQQTSTPLSAPSLKSIATSSRSSYGTTTPKPDIPVLPDLKGISLTRLNALFDDMVQYNPAHLIDTLNTLAGAGLQGGKREFSVSTSTFSLQIKKLDTSSTSTLSVGSAAIQLPSFGENTNVSSASVIKWVSNPYESSVDVPVLAINILSADNSPLTIQNLTTPISMSWPSPVENSPLYTMFCNTGTLFKDEIPSKPLYSFGNGTYLVSCGLNTTMVLECKDKKQGTTASVVCPAPIYTPECLYWNKAISSWTGDGCNASFVNNTIVCECTHLTDFSTRIHSVMSDNVNIFGNAADVYSLKGIEKYSQWYATFGSIGLLALFLMYIGHSCDRPLSKAYLESLLSNKVILHILEKVPRTPLHRYDKTSVYKEVPQKKEVEVKESNFNIFTRLILDNSRLQAFFRYDPRLGRMFRILTLFVIQFHSLFVTGFLYGFIHNDSLPVYWYDVLLLAVITTLFNMPCIFLIMKYMNMIGKEEFINKYPILFEEYKRRVLFEKYALLYKNKSSDEVDVNELDFMNDTDTLAENALMYICCRMKPKVKEGTILKRMSKSELFEILMQILHTPYKKFVKYSPFWEFMPCHTVYGGLFLLCSFGWLGWCLNYLLLFASYHATATSQHILISYVTSELTTIFISQPLTILFTIGMYIYLHRHGDRFPWPFSLLQMKHTKRIPPVFYYSNPWNSTTNSSLTSELAYTMFVKCPADACQLDETSYAPLRSILDKINNKEHVESRIDTGVKDLYMSMLNAKYNLDVTREFV